MKLLQGLTSLDIAAPLARPAPASPPPLAEVLWRRRWTIVAATIACLLSAIGYLLYTAPVYQAVSRVLITSETPRVLREAGVARSNEGFLQTQSDVFMSAAVLARAVQSLDAEKLKTFSGVDHSLIAWLQTSGALEVEPAKKSDVMLVSMQSRVPHEAAAIVNAVVDAYVAEQSAQRSAVNEELLGALRTQRTQLVADRAAIVGKMIGSQRDHQSLSFGDDKRNLALEQMSTVSSSLTTAQLGVVELASQQAALKKALADPQVLRAYVDARQSQGRDFGDREYDDLRNQLNGYEVAYSGATLTQGARHPRTQAMAAVIQSLRQRVEQKQKSLAAGQLATVEMELDAARTKEKSLRENLGGQRDEALALSPSAGVYRQLEADAAQIQRQVDLVDARIAEVSVENLAAVPLNVKVLEAARPPDRPIKPRKGFALAAALVAGWVVGVGLALLREWQDRRVRTPHEAQALLNLPVLAAVPRMNLRLSAPARGQVLRLDARSPGAEAYRALCIAMRWGRAADARTLLVTSPGAADGKSTTASNLATAFAQAGHRTLLIDCDLRHPVQHLIFDADSTLGLSNVLAGEHKLQVAVCTTPAPSLYLLPAGPLPANPSEILGGKRFGQLLRALQQRFDRIVIDSPSVGACADALIVSAVADVTLLVVRMNRSTQQWATLALESLHKVDARVIGLVANEVGALPPGQQNKMWEYAVPTLPRPVRPAAELAGAGSSRRPHTDPPVLDEPDWSIDVQGGRT